MRKLNVKFLVILLLIVVIIAGGVTAALVLKSDPSTKLLEAARTAGKAGEYDTAIKNYRDYLGFNRDDQQVLCEAAVVGSHCLADENIKDSEQRIPALRLMGHALRASPRRNDIRRHLAEGLIAMGQLASNSDGERTFFAEAQKEVQKLRALKKDDSELNFMHAQCADKLEKLSESINALEAMVGYESSKEKFNDKKASAPNMIKAHVLLANIYRKRGRGREDENLADKVIDKMVDRNSENADAYFKRAIHSQIFNEVGSYAQRLKRKERILVDLQKSLSIDPDNLDVLIELVSTKIFARIR